MERWLSMMVYTFNPSTWEAETGGLPVYPFYILKHCQEMKEEEEEERGGRKEKQERKREWKRNKKEQKDGLTYA